MKDISKILLYLMACSIQNTKPEDKVLVGADLEKLLQTAKHILFLQWFVWLWNKRIHFAMRRKVHG